MKGVLAAIIGDVSLNGLVTMYESLTQRKLKAILKVHKTDANDALAVANAALQIDLKCSKPKTIDQQGLHFLETSRQLLTRSMVSIGLYWNRSNYMIFRYGFCILVRPHH
nr:hypothetical protein BCU42_23835 [Vibrio splendidus]PMI72535.1 hypothetical protein BCU38_02765 [Vibrio splendidus]